MRLRDHPCRVLFVDGDLALATHAAALFDSGEVLPCPRHADYESALGALREQRPDVVVVALTALDAFGVIEAIMAEAPTPILALRPYLRARLGPFARLASGRTLRA